MPGCCQRDHPVHRPESQRVLRLCGGCATLQGELGMGFNLHVALSKEVTKSQKYIPF